MKKTATINTFEGGLVKDIYPLVSANNVLCDALNATLITMQGNENVLQNDMGNGRVETAFLPEGYVPLGTASIGGIIYILSYNPLNNRCQVGSFPSPERNITSDKVSSNIQTLTNEDFQFTSNKGAGIYYLKKELNSDLVFNPGDKFIIYGDTISRNFKKFYDESKYNSKDFLDAQEQTMKISIGAVTDTGKLVVFNNDQLKKYKVGGSGDGREFQILQYNPKDGDNDKPDLDQYRSLVSQPYNIFSSKISGRLVIIAELIQFDSFNVAIQNNFRTKLSYEWFNHAIYNPNLKVKFSGESSFIPKGVKCTVQLIGNGDFLGENECTSEYWYLTTPNATSTNYKEYEFTINNFLQDIFINDGTGPGGIIGYSSFETVWKGIRTLANNYDYFGPSKNINDVYILKYTITPYMNWGPITHLTASGSIDLSKLNSGEVQLTGWKYFRTTSTTSNYMKIKYSIEKYLSDYAITSITMHCTRIRGLDEKNEIITDTVDFLIENNNFNDKNIVSIIGEQDIPLYTNNAADNIQCDQLYLVDMEVTLKNDAQDLKEFHFYRILYTNDVFNNYYNQESVIDFKDLSLNLNPTTEINSNWVSTFGDPEYSLGLVYPITNGYTEDEILEQYNNIKSSLSCKQTICDFELKTRATLKLSEDYNLFKLRLSNDSLVRTNCELTNVTSIGNEDQYLKCGAVIAGHDTLNENNLPYFNPLNKYKLSKYNNIDFSDQLFNSPTFVITKKILPNIASSTLNDNVYTFIDKFQALTIEKAYCIWDSSPGEKTLEGSFKPLAYNYDTFKSYGLTYNNEKTYRWIPNTIIGYGFHYQSSPSTYMPTHHMTIYNQIYNGEHNNDDDTDYSDVKWLHGNFSDGTITIPFRWSEGLVKTDMPYSYLENKNYNNLAKYAENDQARFIAHWHDPAQYLEGTYPVKIKYQDIPSYALYSRSNFVEKSRFTLMLPDKDGRFYPINFQSFENYAANKYNKKDDTVGWYNYIADHIVSNSTNQEMLNTFASILNSLYWYSYDEIKINYLPINQIVFSECSSGFTVNMDFKINVQDNLNIILSDGNLLELNTVIQKFKSNNLLPEEQSSNLENNVKCSLNYETTKNHKSEQKITLNTDDFGNYISTNETRGNAIMDYDGNGVIGTVESFEGDNDINKYNKLYFFTGKEGLYSVQLANNINLWNFEYTQSDETGTFRHIKPGDSLSTKDIDFNKYFEVSSDKNDKGKLYIKNISSTDESNDKYPFVIHFPHNSSSGNDLLLTGYQGDIKLIDTYTLAETNK